MDWDRICLAGGVGQDAVGSNRIGWDRIGWAGRILFSNRIGLGSLALTGDRMRGRFGYKSYRRILGGISMLMDGLIASGILTRSRL